VQSRTVSPARGESCAKTSSINTGICVSGGCTK